MFKISVYGLRVADAQLLSEVNDLIELVRLICAYPSIAAAHALACGLSCPAAADSLARQPQQDKSAADRRESCPFYFLLSRANVNASE